MKLSKLIKYNWVLLLPVVVLLLSVEPLFAQTSLSIGVAPTSKILKLSAGETYTDEVVFWNLSQHSSTYKVFVSGFEPIENQPGTAIILTPEDDAKTLSSASKWITVSKEFLDLEPNKNVKLQYTITVPEDIPNAEYNAEIFLISENQFQEQGTAAFANLAAGMPILIQIGDEFAENAEILRFTSDKKIYEKIDVNFLTTIKNLGDVHISPIGEIVVENIFKQEVARVPFNKNTQSLLSDHIGNYQDTWVQSGYLSPNHSIILGPLKAKVLITYRSFQPGFATLTSETTFWVIPWKIILTILGIILLGIMVRASKKRIEEKA